MKLVGINSACDLRAVSLLPPRSGGGRASTPAPSAADGHRAQVLLPPPQQPFSLGLGGGGGDASLLHPKQPRLSDSGASVDEDLRGLHRPTPAHHQGFGLHEDSSKRMPPFPPSLASRAQEEPQQQLAMISNSTGHRWNPSHTDTRSGLMKEAGSESGLQLVWRARKRRTRSETMSIYAATLLPDVIREGEKRGREPEPEAQTGVHAVEAAPARRARRRNPKYDASQWISC